MGQARGASVYSIKEVCQMLGDRQLNQFDANFAVSGKRGNGKSTLILKMLERFKKKGFNQEKHQVYERDDVMKLLSTQKFGFCWDDEAINSGYKRDFQNKGQHELIKLVTNYRDNFNLYASAIPSFYSLDRDLRDLIFMHIHIIERGVAVMFLPVDEQIHSGDQWDTKYNQKVEEEESKNMAKNPRAKFKYHRFSTFAGYIYFNDVTENQRKTYEEIKHRKRAKRFEKDKATEKPDMETYLYNQLLKGELTDEVLFNMVKFEGKQLHSVSNNLRRKLRQDGSKNTLQGLIKKAGQVKAVEPPKEAIALEVPIF